MGISTFEYADTTLLGNVSTGLPVLQRHIPDEIPSIIFSPRFLFLILVDQQIYKPSDHNAYSDIRRLIYNVLKKYTERRGREVI